MEQRGGDMANHAERLVRAHRLIAESTRLGLEPKQVLALAHKKVRRSLDIRNQFEFQTAKVTCCELGRPDVVQADFSGVLDAAAVSYLGEIVVMNTLRSRVLVERIDKALMLFDKPIALLPTYPERAPPGCFIVRPDQLDAAFSFSQRLASVGILRTVFVAGVEERLAQEWVREVAA